MKVYYCQVVHYWQKIAKNEDFFVNIKGLLIIDSLQSRSFLSPDLKVAQSTRKVGKVCISYNFPIHWI